MNWKSLRKKTLSFATDILPKLPNLGDSPLTLFIKVLSIVDSLEKKVAEDSALHTFFSKVDAIPDENAQFVDLFYSTDLKNSFTVKRYVITEYVEVVMAEDPEIGSLYFIEYHWRGKPEPAPSFWFSPGFNFEKALCRMWGMYKGGIHINLSPSKEREGLKTTYESLEFTTDPILGPSAKRLEEASQRHGRYVANGFPRTYLFVGKQGTGKSTFATRLAQAHGKRTLCIGTKGMTLAGASDISFLIKGLKPDFLILDDIDRVVDKEAALPTLLEALTKLKEHHKSVTTILTANNIEAFDPAFLRPGRIDQIFEFSDPPLEERRMVLEGYLKEYGSVCSNPVAIARATQGLTPAYLREIAIQLRCDSAEEVLTTIKQMKRLVERKPLNDSKKGPPPPAPEPKAT